MIKSTQILRLDSSCFAGHQGFDVHRPLHAEIILPTVLLQQRVEEYRDSEIDRLKLLLQSLMPA